MASQSIASYLQLGKEGGHEIGSFELNEMKWMSFYIVLQVVVVVLFNWPDSG